MITTKITIQGFNCPACVKLTKMKLEEIPGVSEARVEETGAAEILADREIARPEIEQTLAGTGYTVQT